MSSAKRYTILHGFDVKIPMLNMNGISGEITFGRGGAEGLNSVVRVSTKRDQFHYSVGPVIIISKQNNSFRLELVNRPACVL